MNTELSKAETERIVSPFSAPVSLTKDNPYGIMRGPPYKGPPGYSMRNEPFKELFGVERPDTLTVIRHTYPSPYFLASIAISSAAIGGLAAWWLE